MEEEGNRSDANSNIDGISIVSTPFSFLFVDFVPEPKLLLVHMKYDDAVAEMNKIIYHFFYLHLFGPFFYKMKNCYLRQHYRQFLPRLENR